MVGREQLINRDTLSPPMFHPLADGTANHVQPRPHRFNPHGSQNYSTLCHYRQQTVQTCEKHHGWSRIHLLRFHT
jgi:hypothetical protein